MFPAGARAALVWNPAAGRRKSGRRLRRIREAFGRAGIPLEETPTTAPGHAEALARRHADAGAAAVFCWGGDGTLAEAARGLLDRGAALAPLPGGTVNVLARELGIPGEESRAVAALLAGRALAVRPGLARRTGPAAPSGFPAETKTAASAPESEERLFLSICSVGLDAAAARRVGARTKRRGGLARWAIEGARVFLGSPVPDLRVRILPAAGAGEWSDPVPAAWAGVGTQSRYTRWLPLFPGARIEHPELVAALVGSRNRFAIPLVAAAAALGRPAALPGVRVARAAAVRIVPAGDSADSPPCQCDGDAFAAAPVEITRSAGTLRLLAPAGYRGEPNAGPAR